MSQMMFKQYPTNTPDDKKTELKNIIKKAYNDLRVEINNKLIFDDVINGKTLETKHTQLFKAPEDLTIEILIEPILKFLGYQKLHKSTSCGSKIESRESDYTLFVNDEKILVEAEALNKDLGIKKSGIDQLAKYLRKRSFNAIMVLLQMGSDGFLSSIIKKTINN